MDPNKKVIGTVVLHSTVTRFYLHKMHYLRERLNVFSPVKFKNLFLVFIKKFSLYKNQNILMSSWNATKNFRDTSFVETV